MTAEGQNGETKAKKDYTALKTVTIELDFNLTREEMDSCVLNLTNTLQTGHQDPFPPTASLVTLGLSKPRAVDVAPNVKNNPRKRSPAIPSTPHAGRNTETAKPSARQILQRGRSLVYTQTHRL